MNFLALLDKDPPPPVSQNYTTLMFLPVMLLLRLLCLYKRDYFSIYNIPFWRRNPVGLILSKCLHHHLPIWQYCLALEKTMMWFSQLSKYANQGKTLWNSYYFYIFQNSTVLSFWSLQAEIGKESTLIRYSIFQGTCSIFWIYSLKPWSSWLKAWQGSLEVLQKSPWHACAACSKDTSAGIARNMTIKG